jgi:hypothetical protein
LLPLTNHFINRIHLNRPLALEIKAAQFSVRPRVDGDQFPAKDIIGAGFGAFIRIARSERLVTI